MAIVLFKIACLKPQQSVAKSSYYQKQHDTSLYIWGRTTSMHVS